MASLGQLLRSARERNGYTQQEVADRYGISRNSVTLWEGDKNRPEADRLIDLCNWLGIRLTELHVATSGDDPLVAINVHELRETAPDYGVVRRSSRSGRIPVVGTAQLGDGGFYEELQYPAGHGEGFLDFPSRDPNAYALRVRGDSMRPRIKPGEFVVVEPNRAPQVGDDVVVKTIDGRSMVKQLALHRDGIVELRSVNEAHAPITLEEKEIVAMHKAYGALPRDLFIPA